MKEYLKKQDIEFSVANMKQLVFEVTDACNLKCKYCAYGEFYNDYDKREDQMLSVDKALRLIDLLTEYWMSDKNISTEKIIYISFYGGEPLLNMPFVESVVNYVNGLNGPNYRFGFSMTTNAILLDKYMDFLRLHEFNLLISLDGNKENTAYRVDKSGRSAFERIEKNVDKLREKYPDYFETQVNFNAVLHNKNSVEEIYQYFKTKYDKIPSIGELNNSGIQENQKDEFKKAYRNAQESLMQSEHYEKIEQEMFIEAPSYRNACLFLHQYSGFVYHDYTDLLFERKDVRHYPTGTCIPFSKKMFVTVNGKILPCERIGHQFALGEITDTNIELDMQSIADRCNAYFAKFEKQCGDCKNKACTQCMFNVEKIDTNPVCYGYMNQNIFNRYFDAQMSFFEKHPSAYKEILEKVIIE